MPFNLIMKRKVFATVQVLCSEYEDKFNEKLATASVVNVLIAEALQHRGLIPHDFIKKNYGSADPIGVGFTARAREEKSDMVKLQEQNEIKKMSQYFSGVLEQFNWEHFDPDWKRKKIAEAKLWQDRVRSAKMVVALANGEVT